MIREAGFARSQLQHISQGHDHHLLLSQTEQGTGAGRAGFGQTWELTQGVPGPFCLLGGMQRCGPFGTSRNYTMTYEVLQMAAIKAHRALAGPQDCRNSRVYHLGLLLDREALTLFFRTALLG